MILRLNTVEEQEFLDITGKLRDYIKKEGLQSGLVVVYVPHTTAAVTINENGDPDVIRDIIISLNKSFPVDGDYLHFEGNSHAHIKASLLGSSCTLLVREGKLQLGRWQSVYFCEFDGPRPRQVFLKILPS